MDEINTSDCVAHTRADFRHTSGQNQLTRAEYKNKGKTKPFTLEKDRQTERQIKRKLNFYLCLLILLLLPQLNCPTVDLEILSGLYILS